MDNDVALRPLRVLSVCSGAGQLDRGLAGAVPSTTVCYVERELTAAAVLVARMEDGALDRAPVWDDVTTFNAGEWRGAVDCVLSGFPCQPHSVAGKRLGAEDERDLWPVVLRVVRDCEPEWVGLENVPGAIPYFQHFVVPGLQALGYSVAALLCEAADVGAPHRRERLFVLARNVAYGWGDDDGRADGAGGREREPEARGGVLADASDGQLQEPRRGEEGRTRPAGSVLVDAVSERGRSGEAWGQDAADAQAAGRAVGDTYEQRSQGQRGEHRLQEGGVEAQAQWPSAPFPPGPTDHAGWDRVLRERPDLAPALEPEIRQLASRMAPGLVESDLTRAAKLRLAGNGVCPQQAAFAFGILFARFGYVG